MKTNRNYANMVQHGLTEGLFKVNQGGKIDCLKEGMTIARAWFELLYKVIFLKKHEPTTELDVMNIM